MVQDRDHSFEIKAYKRQQNIKKIGFYNESQSNKSLIFEKLLFCVLSQCRVSQSCHQFTNKFFLCRENVMVKKTCGKVFHFKRKYRFFYGTFSIYPEQSTKSNNVNRKMRCIINLFKYTFQYRMSRRLKTRALCFFLTTVYYA